MEKMAYRVQLAEGGNMLIRDSLSAFVGGAWAVQNCLIIETVYFLGGIKKGLNGFLSLDGCDYGCTILDFADIRYADIFQLILADTNIFPFVWKQHHVSPVQKL